MPNANINCLCNVSFCNSRNGIVLLEHVHIICEQKLNFICDF